MKKLNHLLVMAFALPLVIVSCQKNDVSKESISPVSEVSISNNKVKTVEFSFVQSGNYSLNDNTITSIRKFSKQDNQIATVAKTDKNNATSNALMIDNNQVIVFESSISERLKALSKDELLNEINKISWKSSSFNYNQPLDVVEKVESNGLKLRVREAGVYNREEGMIDNQVVYKFKNNVYTEDYTNLTDGLNEYTNKSISVDLLQKLNLNASNFTISSNSEWFKIQDNKVVLVQSASKPTNTFGIVYIKPVNENEPAYRIRLFYHEIPANIKAKYFSNNKLVNFDEYVNEYYTKIVNDNIPTCIFLNKQLRDSSADKPIPPGGFNGE